MNVYMESRGFFRNFSLICKLKKAFAGEACVTILNRGIISGMHMMALIGNRGAFRTIALSVPVRYLGPVLRNMHNTSRVLELIVLVDRPLTGLQKRRIDALDRVIRVVDTTGGKNDDFYCSRRRILVTGRPGPFVEANAFAYACTEESPYSCCAATCGGTTLYIDKGNRVFSCPSCPEDSYLGKGNGCHFPEPGHCICPYSGWEQALDAANRERDELIAKGADLSALPFYKEQAFLGYLFQKK